MKPLTRFAAMMAALLAAAPQLLAQGCAMCYTEAAAQGPRAARQLDIAILTLLVPSILLFAGVLFAAFRRRERDVAAAQPGAHVANPPQAVVSRPRARLDPNASPSSL